MNIPIETVRTETFTMDYFRFGRGRRTLVILLYMYIGYGHAAFDTAPDYRQRILRFLNG